MQSNGTAQRFHICRANRVESLNKLSLTSDPIRLLRADTVVHLVDAHAYARWLRESAFERHSTRLSRSELFTSYLIHSARRELHSHMSGLRCCLV